MDWVEVDKMGGETGPNTQKKSPSYPILSKGPVGQQIEHIYRDRLGQFKDGGQYKGQSLAGYVNFIWAFEHG
jgi:alpha-mannosidase